MRAALLVAVLAAGVSDGVVCNSLKHLVGRPRPHEALSGIRMVDLAKATPRLLALAKPIKVTLSRAEATPGGRSFPSAHTTNCTAVAVVAALFTARWAWSLLAIPLVVGYSRIYTGAHWPSDIAASLLLGLAHRPALHLGRRGALAATRAALAPPPRHPPSPPAPRMTPRRLLLAFLFGLCALRLCLIGLFELSPDESYYYLWSEHLDLSYYSKGPGIAVTMWLSTHLFGATEFGIRFFSPILSLITALLMFRLARRLYSEEVAIWTTVALSCVPIYQVGGLLMTIDPLSMCFWMAALYTCWRALEQSPRFSAWWPATGLLIGLGFLCKWTNALQLLSILLLLAFTPKYRRELRHAGFWSMLAAFLPCTLPPVIWNMQHDWITLIHLKERGGFNHAASLDFGEFFTFLGGQFAVYSPVIFGAMLAAIWLGVSRARMHFKPRFLLAFALPILALYFTLSLARSRRSQLDRARHALARPARRRDHARARARAPLAAPHPVRRDGVRRRDEPAHSQHRSPAHPRRAAAV